jgi:hypothetical protein
MGLTERIRLRRQSWKADARFRPDGPAGSELLQLIPSWQRDAIELAAWLECSVAKVAALRPDDVRADGVKVGSSFVAWPIATSPRLRESVLALARATPPETRLYEAYKPRIRAAFDLRSAMGQAIAAENLSRRLAASQVDARAPDFLVLGVPRSATTWLYAALSTHPDIYLPESKEQEFFGDFQFPLGRNWYFRYFAARAGQRVAGDVSIGYFHSPEAPAQIAGLLGRENVKLVVIVREPIQRARSYYNTRLALGMAPSTFEKAIDIPYFHDLLIARGHYARYLERWYGMFDRDRLLVLLYEDIQRNPTSALATLSRFLGVSPDGFTVPQRENAGVKIAGIALHRFLLRSAADLEALLAGRPAPVGGWLARQVRKLDASVCLRPGQPYDAPVRPTTMRRLQEEFAEGNERLARMTGLDLAAWRYARP